MFPYYPICLYRRNQIESVANFNSLYKTGNGLCNQIFALVTGIIKSSIENRPYCIIDSFNCCIEKGNIIEIEKIINLEETTLNLNKIQGLENIILFDRSNFKIELIDAHYGIDDVRKINVKANFDDKFNYRTNSMNEFFGVDPFPNIIKYLYTKFIVNDKIIIHKFDENCNNFHELFNANYILNDLFKNKTDDFSWYNRFDKELFSLILKNIRFTDVFYEILEVIKQNHEINSNLAVIHFRLEQDAINHWSIQNKMNKHEFEQLLSTKYETLINKYIEPNQKIYILSADENNVINKFCNNKFIYTSLKIKDEYLSTYFNCTGRELCGIIDLLIGIHCSKLFIGCHSYKLSRGSSFSYVISENIGCRRILIDLDDINNPEEVHD